MLSEGHICAPKWGVERGPGLEQALPERPGASTGESRSCFPQLRPHETDLTEGMDRVVAHATAAHPQALLALDLRPFPLPAIGLDGGHRALSQLLAPF
jgi:hypothetical protein